MTKVWKHALLLFFSVVSTCVSYWQPLSLEYGEALLKEMAVNDSFHFALVCNNNNLYRRPLRGTLWEQLPKTFTPPITVEHMSVLQNKLFIGDTVSRFYSEDNGLTWRDDTSAMDLENSVEIGNTLFTINRISQNKRVEYLPPGNGHWTLSKEFNETISSITAGEERLYIGGWGHLFVSADMGAKWDTLAEGLPERTAIAYIYEHSPTVIFAATEKGLFYTTDGGDRWELFCDSFSKSRMGDVQSLYSFSPEDTVLYAIATNGLIYELHVSDKSVQQMTPPIETDELLSAGLVIGDTLWVGGDQELYLFSKKSDAWGAKGALFPKTLTLDMIYDNSEYDFLFTKGMSKKATLFRKKKENHQSWEKVASFTDGVTNVLVADSLLRFYSGEFGERDLFVSRDNGERWDTLLSIDEKNPEFYKGGKVLQYGSTLFFYGTGYLLKSDDNGRNWDSVKTVFNVDQMVVSADRILMTTKTSAPFVHTSLYYSDDAGESFSPCDDTAMTNNILSLVAYGRDVMGVKDGSIYLSNNRGDSWIEFSRPWGEAVEKILYMDDSYTFCKGTHGQYFYRESDEWDWSPFTHFSDAQRVQLFPNKGELLAFVDNELYIGHPEAMVGAITGAVAATQNMSVRTHGKHILLQQAVQDVASVSVQLYSLKGQRMTSRTVTVPRQSHIPILDLTPFAAGKYIVQIRCHNQKLFQLVTIQ